MEHDMKTALAVSLIQSKPDEINIVDYVTNIQSEIIKEENERFAEEFFSESEPTNLPFDLPEEANENTSLPLSFLDLHSFENMYNYNMTPEKDIPMEYKVTSSNKYCASALDEKSSVCLVQPIITMKILSGITDIPIDSGYNTNDWCTNQSDNIQRPIDMMSQSIQIALDILKHTLFNSSELLDVVTNWDESNNIIRYFVDYVASMENNVEFGFTCRGSVILFVQEIAFKILDNQHLYSTIHVEYQCNLFVKLCYDKHIRWNTINLLINRLKIDVQIVPSYNSHQSIFYTFYIVDKLLLSDDFTTTKIEKNKINLIDLWKIDQTNTDKDDTKCMKTMLKDWKISLEYIAMETFRNKVFLVSIRANQCLDALKHITIN